ncbi:hypothetical protein KHA90_04905 [Flavobacterium psychroterrae]|uniref:Uncharacterized protein n=1 Tax=Flavobacterium psychroterrae TaxID=2133767 RepID=A0ABS5P7S0_9FLAO|nr:hypothetical protein [Flavobacterium psychroterrae]MBS7230355.1 hypothetical protein [Flavobacterium psychroterrae]
MIKKENKYFNTTINSTKLYLEDIENIISKIENENIILEISDNENVYESIAELRSITGTNPKTIKILGTLTSSFLEYITIRITESSSTIYVHNSDTLLKPAYEIENLLISKKRKLIYSYFNSYNAKINLLCTLLIGFVVFLVCTFITKENFNYTIWVSIILLWTLIFLISELNPNSNTKIELERKHELNFYEKNKDKILFGIVTTFIGIIIGSIITYLKS